MDTRLNTDQKVLKETVARFLAEECSKALVRELETSHLGYSPALWQKMAGLGWQGMMIPEAFGGTNRPFQDLAILLEEIGKNILPGPLFSTIACTFPVVEAGTNAQRSALLPKIADGTLISTPALFEVDGTMEAVGIITKAEPIDDGFVISGTKRFVEMAHVSDYFLCPVRTTASTNPERGVTVFLVPTKTSGVEIELMPTMAMDKQCEVRLENVVVSGNDVIGELDGGWSIVKRLVERGAVAKCAESVGGMQACLDMVVSYSKQRVQYSHPIGAYQALQHHMADMWIALVTSRYLVYQTACKESEGLPVAKEASMTKAYVNEAYKELTKWAVRLHGAIGVTREHDAGLYFRRAKAADVAFGSTRFHRELVARELDIA